MQIQELIAPIGQPTEWMPVARRVAIISPAPHEFHELVGQLSSRQFDVLVLHGMDPDLLPKLDVQVYLFDMTRMSADVPEWNEAIRQLADCRQIITLGEANGPVQDCGCALPWPGCAVQIADQVERMADRLPPTSGFHPGSRKRRVKDLVIDYDRLTVRKGNQPIELTKTEFDILRVLMEAEGAVLTREDIADGIWGERFTGSNTIDVHIKSLRHKLGDNPRHPNYIVTVRGFGYRFDF